jgi:hypothetical protein
MSNPDLIKKLEKVFDEKHELENGALKISHHTMSEQDLLSNGIPNEPFQKKVMIVTR